MTQRRVENTRVQFWTFSPVSVKLTDKESRVKNLIKVINRLGSKLTDFDILSCDLLKNSEFE